MDIKPKNWPYLGSIASAEKTPITIWKVLSIDDSGVSFKFNHIEDGWNGTNGPTPKNKQQESAWKKQVWAGIYGWLIKYDGRLIVEPFRSVSRKLVFVNKKI